MEDLLETMNDDMHEAEHDLENLEKCCGLCVLPWNRFARYYDVKSTRHNVELRRDSLAEITGKFLEKASKRLVEAYQRRILSADDDQLVDSLVSHDSLSEPQRNCFKIDQIA